MNTAPHPGLHADFRLVYHNHTLLEKQRVTFGGNTGVDWTALESDRLSPHSIE